MADWIFQGSPREHGLDARIAASPGQWWGTPRYRDRMAVGDRVWVQVTGPHHPGIYYVATIVSATYEHPLQPGEPAYARWRTGIRVDYRIRPPCSGPNCSTTRCSDRSGRFMVSRARTCRCPLTSRRHYPNEPPRGW
jgi:hypothetical protein